MDLYELLLAFQSAVNTQQGGHIRPERNYITWVNEINTEIFNELGEDFEKSQTITDALSPFLKTLNAVVQPQTGSSWDLIPFPEDYSRFSSARIIVRTDKPDQSIAQKGDVMRCPGNACVKWDDDDELAKQALEAGNNTQETGIVKVDNQRWGSVMQHVKLKPTKQRPYLTQYSGGFKVAPRGMGIIVIDYLRKPRKAVFAYTIGTQDEIVYDQANSVQLEWPDSMFGTFVARLKKRYGSATGEQDKYEQGEQERKQTKA